MRCFLMLRIVGLLLVGSFTTTIAAEDSDPVGEPMQLSFDLSGITLRARGATNNCW